MFPRVPAPAMRARQACAGAEPVIRSMIERTASGAPRLRDASITAPRAAARCIAQPRSTGGGSLDHGTNYGLRTSAACRARIAGAVLVLAGTLGSFGSNAGRRGINSSPPCPLIQRARPYR